MTWLRVDPRNPAILYVGGSFDCPDPTRGNLCSDWALRSTDRGQSWADLRGPLHVILQPSASDDVTTIVPALIGSDGQHIYLQLANNFPGHGPDAGSPAYLMSSGDSGVHWENDHSPPPTLADFDLYPSPLSPTRLYAVMHNSVGPGQWLSVSSDAGRTWHSLTNPDEQLGLCCHDLSLVPDPVHINTVYANVRPYGDPPVASIAVGRSEDGGVTWAQVITPTGALSSRTFAVSTDLHMPGLLVGIAADGRLRSVRRYLSADGGRTWRTGTCPGGLPGVGCPSFTVDNIFGAGAAYAFINHGIYRFHGSGLAEVPLPIGAKLPVRMMDLVDVHAGTRAGDPIYLLGRGVHGTIHGVLYRSTDGGQSWQQLLVGVSLMPNALLPNPADPASPACCGAQFFPHTKHNMKGPFLAFYQKYGGLDTFGYPRTEPLTETGHLVQYTDRFLLELIGGQVVTAPLGRLLTQARTFAPVAAVATTPDRLYFASTRHTLSGRFLVYWQSQHGATLLGPPIAEPMQETNGDGSGRAYEVQWFANGRLEYHPERAGTRYEVEYGLVGKQALQLRGWL